MPTVASLTLIKDALMEIGVYSQGETPSAADAAFGLAKLNRLFDSWNAKKLNIYNDELTSYTLTPALQPHTIGPTGTFVVAQRPVSIERANMVQTSSTPNVYIPMNIRDSKWWANLRVRATTSTIPTDLYYDETFPNGSIYLWPVPSAAYDLEILTWTVLGQIPDLVTNINLPPGYLDAVTYTLALTMCSAFDAVPAPVLVESWKKSMQVIQTLNSKAPRISTRDWGMPMAGPERTAFNYLTGGFNR